MNSLTFLLQYIFKPRTVGAVLPSSKYLAKKMLASVDFDVAKCIVEYGAGTGVFTKRILEKRHPDTVIIVFEKNEAFYQSLTNKYGAEPNVYIVNESAENVGQHLQKCGLEYADYIVSGLPFTSLPAEVSENILVQTKKYLSESGTFITFQYSLLKMEFIRRFFISIETELEIRNIPPAYVLRCR